MTCKEMVEFGANVASIATPIVGVIIWCIYRRDLCRKRKALEDYLKKERAEFKKSGKERQHTFQHLTAELGLTESEILQASFGNPRIKRFVKQGKDGLASEILFQYNDD